MYITHSYIGTIREPYRCLFFLLIEDYIEAQTKFARDLDLYLERFSRRVGNSAALVRPFVGDIETVRQQVLEMPWSDRELQEIRKTPALLMIDQDFDSFDPREHPWMVINFGRRKTEIVPEASLFENTFDELIKVVLDANEDFFTAAHNLKYEIKGTEFAEIFEAKPGLFGFSINLYYAGAILQKIYARMRGPKNNG